VTFSLGGLPFDGHSQTSDPTQLVEPGTQTSSTQMVPLQNRLAGQSTSVVQAMLTHSAPPPAVGWHSSVTPHWSVAQSLFTQLAEPVVASQCWSGGQGNPTHGSAWPPVPLLELVVKRLPPLPEELVVPLPPAPPVAPPPWWLVPEVVLVAASLPHAPTSAAIEPTNTARLNGPGCCTFT
jgi:hypothetical protein